MVDLLGVEVEQMSLEEGVELRGLGEVEAAMGAGLARKSCRVEGSLSHRFLHGCSYCK